MNSVKLRAPRVQPVSVRLRDGTEIPPLEARLDIYELEEQRDLQEAIDGLTVEMEGELR